MIPVVPLALAGACSTEARTDLESNADEVYLGPDHVPMVDLPNPTVLYSIGDSVGPGMLTDGRGLLMARVSDDEQLVYTSFADSILLFRSGRFVAAYGRRGSGPGEFTQPNGFTTDPRTGRIWLLDRGGARLVSFAADGAAGEVVSAAYAGSSARQPVVLPDGSLVLNGEGGRQENTGYLIHHYDPATKTWSSYHPVLRNSSFETYSDRRWIRRLAVAPDGRLIAVSHDYVVEIFDAASGFRLETRIRRRPASWPEDVDAENARRLREDPVSPRFLVTNAWVDERNRLWVLGSMPDRQWRDKLGPDPRRPWEPRSLGGAIDWGLDAVVEVIDLSDMRVLQSHRLDAWARYIVGAGRVAHSARDLPYPQVDVIAIPVPEGGD
jgi:hypothetical protein